MHFYRKNRWEGGQSLFGYAHKTWNGNITLIFLVCNFNYNIVLNTRSRTHKIQWSISIYMRQPMKFDLKFFWLKFQKNVWWMEIAWLCVCVLPPHTNVHASIISHSSENMNINTYIYSYVVYKQWPKFTCHKATTHKNHHHHHQQQQCGCRRWRSWT